MSASFLSGPILWLDWTGWLPAMTGQRVIGEDSLAEGGLSFSGRTSDLERSEPGTCVHSLRGRWQWVGWIQLWFTAARGDETLRCDLLQALACLHATLKGSTYRGLLTHAICFLSAQDLQLKTSLEMQKGGSWYNWKDTQFSTVLYPSPCHELGLYAVWWWANNGKFWQFCESMLCFSESSEHFDKTGARRAFCA